MAQPSAKRSLAITPNDSANLAFVTNSLFVGGAGTLKVELQNDASGNFVTLTVLAGQFLDLRVRKVWATGTSATGLIGLA